MVCQGVLSLRIISDKGQCVRMECAYMLFRDGWICSEIVSPVGKIGWGVLSLMGVSDKGQCVCIDLAYVIC
jgi:hypothetical protein